MPSYLLDTNILLRAADPASLTHTQAVAAVAKLLADGNELFITAQNIIEFWAVSTRPISANGFGWDAATGVREIQQLLSQFPLLEEMPGVFRQWLDLVTRYSITGKRAHDARLVAAMQAHGLSHLLTFNVDDFRNYSGLDAVHPDRVT